MLRTCRSPADRGLDTEAGLAVVAAAPAPKLLGNVRSLIGLLVSASEDGVLATAEGAAAAARFTPYCRVGKTRR